MLVYVLGVAITVGFHCQNTCPKNSVNPLVLLLAKVICYSSNCSCSGHPHLETVFHLISYKQLNILSPYINMNKLRYK